MNWEESLTKLGYTDSFLSHPSTFATLSTKLSTMLSTGNTVLKNNDIVITLVKLTVCIQKLLLEDI